MARLFVNDQWYQGLASTELYEREFESLVFQDADQIFPGWRLLPFKVDVYATTDCRRPDYALLDPLYRCWWVVEVEMAHHSLDGHVLRQVQTFAQGHYGRPHVEYLLRQAPDLDVTALATLMRTTPPGIYVLVNLPRPHWERPLAQEGAKLGVVELFRSDHNELALLVNGYIPDLPRKGLTLCWRDPLIPRLLRVESPAALPVSPGSSVSIEFDGRSSEWFRQDTERMTYLCPQKGWPLSGERKLQLERRQDGSLVLLR